MNRLPVLLPSTPLVLRHLGKLQSEIERAPTLERLKHIERAAEAYQKAFRKVSKDVSDAAGEVQIAADDRLAAELAKLPKATGTRGQIKGRRKGSNKSSGGTLLERPDKAATLAELGLPDRKRVARAKNIHAITKSERKKYIAELKRDGKDITSRTVLARHRITLKEAVKQEIIRAKFSADGPFGTVVIDPPWKMEKIDRDERPNQAAFPYGTMSVDDLVEFWRSDMKCRIEKDCHLFMWTTQKWLPASFDVLDRIGFRYVFTMVWHKSGGFQPIGLPQYNCEFVIYARVGSPIFTSTKNFFCCFKGARREHSRKPVEFYETIRRVTGGSRVDVFSRERQNGFAQYGNEIDKFSEAAE